MLIRGEPFAENSTTTFIGERNAPGAVIKKETGFWGYIIYIYLFIYSFIIL